MPGTFLFVHGTGVRKAGYDATCTTIQEKLSQHGFAGVGFTGCLWGDPLGTKTDRVGDTLPPDVQTRALLDTVSDAEIEAATWALLRDDPLFELRIAAEMPPRSSNGISVGTLSPEQVAVMAVRGLATAPLDLTGTGLAQADVVKAADLVAASTELRDNLWPTSVWTVWAE